MGEGELVWKKRLSSEPQSFVVALEFWWKWAESTLTFGTSDFIALMVCDIGEHCTCESACGSASFAAVSSPSAGPAEQNIAKQPS